MPKVINFLLVLFLFSCGEAGNRMAREKDDPLFFRFQFIEKNLQEFANKHNAKVSTVWSTIQTHDPDGTDSFLVKHIVWTDGRLGKAVFIGQHSGIEGVDSATWDFSNIAWLQDTLVTVQPTYVHHLLKNVGFQIIERDIEQLLRTSEKNLQAVSVEDLK